MSNETTRTKKQHKHILIHPKIKYHIEWTTKAGMCSKCVHPWHKGICSCNGWGKDMDEIADLANALLREGWQE